MDLLKLTLSLLILCLVTALKCPVGPGTGVSPKDRIQSGNIFSVSYCHLNSKIKGHRRRLWRLIFEANLGRCLTLNKKLYMFKLLQNT